MQVAPAELEEVLLTNPKIADAAVIGVDGEGTEVPRLVTIAYTCRPQKKTSRNILRLALKVQGFETSHLHQLHGVTFDLTRSFC